MVLFFLKCHIGSDLKATCTGTVEASDYYLQLSIAINDFL